MNEIVGEFQSTGINFSKHLACMNIQYQYVKHTQKKVYLHNFNQLDAQNVCSKISSFHASTCFEHMCLSSGGQNCRGYILQF